MLDFRIGSRKVGDSLPIGKKGGSLSYSLPNLRQVTSSKRDLKAPPLVAEEKDDELPYVYSANKLPKQKQMFYQLCDLHDSEIQQLISANDEEVGCLSDLVVII